MINNTVYSNAGVNRDLQRPCVISQVTGLAVSYAGSVGIALSAGTESATSGTVVMSNGGGVEFGMSASTITALHSGNVSATGNTLATNSVSMTIGSAIVFAASGGASIGVSNGSVVISGATGGGGGGGGVALSAGTNSTGTGTVVFSNANGVTFGMNTNAAITASTALPINADGDLSTVTELIFTNSNGVSFGLTGGSVSLSHNGLTSQSAQAVSAGNGSVAFQTVSFSNANGISFSTAAGPALVASHNGITSQSNQTGNISATGNTIATNSTSATYAATGLVFAGSGVASVGVSNGSVVVSVPSGGGAGDGFNRIAAGTRTATSLGTVLFDNANGVTFGLDGVNGSVITASHNGLTSQSAQAITAGNGSFAFETLSFSNANGISFSTSAGSAIVASHNGLTSQSNQAFSAGAASSTFQTLSFQDSNGVSFSNNAGAVRVTHDLQFTSATSAITSNALHSSASRVINIVAATDSTGGGTASLSSNVSFSNANGFTFYTSAGSALALSASQATLSNSNNVSFGLNAGVITATATWPSLLASFGTSNTSGSTQTLSSGSLVFAAGSNITLSGSTAAGAQTITIHGASGGGGGGVAIAAGGATATSGTVVFSNDNGVSFGLDGSVVTATVAIGIAAVSADGVEATSGGIEFSNANGVSFGLDGATITASVVPPTTHSCYLPHQNRLFVVGQQGQGTLHLWPYSFPDLSINRVGLVVHNTNSSNSSGSHTLSFWFGLYTRSNSSLSLLASASNTTAITHSGTAGSYSLFSGNRLFTLGLSTLLPASDYWVGIISRTTSAGTNGTYSQVLVSAMASNFLGHFGSSHNTTYQSGLGAGVYTATTSAFPASIAFSQIRGSDSLAMRSPVWMLQNGTV